MRNRNRPTPGLIPTVEDTRSLPFAALSGSHIKIQDPGLRFAPPWASEVYHAFGVPLRSELLVALLQSVFFTLNTHGRLRPEPLRPQPIQPAVPFDNRRVSSSSTSSSNHLRGTGFGTKKVHDHTTGQLHSEQRPSLFSSQRKCDQPSYCLISNNYINGGDAGIEDSGYSDQVIRNRVVKSQFWDCNQRGLFGE